MVTFFEVRSVDLDFSHVAAQELRERSLNR
jgi:hypothetical protein